MLSRETWVYRSRPFLYRLSSKRSRAHRDGYISSYYPEPRNSSPFSREGAILPVCWSPTESLPSKDSKSASETGPDRGYAGIIRVKGFLLFVVT